MAERAGHDVIEETYSADEVMRKFTEIPDDVRKAIYYRARLSCPDCAMPSRGRVSPQSWAVAAYEAAMGVVL